MPRDCCAGMLACVSNVVMEVEGSDVVWGVVVAGSGVTRSNYPTEYSHLPSTNSQGLPLDPCSLRSVRYIATYFRAPRLTMCD